MADLLGVGEHLMDHPMVNVILEETSGGSFYYFGTRSLLQRIKFIFVVVQYLLTGKGPMTTGWMGTGAFLRSSDPKLFPPDLYLQEIEDSTLPRSRESLIIIDEQFSPRSVGTVRLRSANPFNPPIINPNDEPHELWFGPNLTTASDSGLIEYIQLKLETLYHPISTARGGWSRQCATEMAAEMVLHAHRV
ncbi:hypothetical protein DFH07DRAFT_955794 [Mycena maculata]|uniref:Uncharacterized protein n=1 Tax=Mycena maculata TaxID=230809 RepID=A0AAD7JLG2_9AGAR|nr:hypothetical protein DFH07DRAFT_955794 [Mycena maculata]